MKIKASRHLGKTPYKEILQILECLTSEDMSEEEYLEMKHFWFRRRWLKGGYFKALDDIYNFWIRYEPGLKENKLNNYQGILIVLKKLIEYKRQFFELGVDINLPFTNEELQPKRKKK